MCLCLFILLFESDIRATCLKEIKFPHISFKFKPNGLPKQEYANQIKFQYPLDLAIDYIIIITAPQASASSPTVYK